MTIDKSKLRNTQNVYLTTGLFNKPDSPYTLSDEDSLTKPSLRKLYLEERDPLEHTFANKYLYNWEHWQTLCSCDWFKPYVESWRKELEVQIRSEALVKVVEEAKDPSNRNYFQALRYLLDKGYLEDDSPKKGRGRPKKPEVVDNSFSQLRLKEDTARILTSSVSRDCLTSETRILKPEEVN